VILDTLAVDLRPCALVRHSSGPLMMTSDSAVVPRRALDVSVNTS
jgi:hypothetical protein